MVTATITGTDELTRRLLEIGADMPIAQMRAINRTLEGARTRAVDGIVADLGGTVTKTAIRRSILLKKATPRDLVGDLGIGPYLRDDGQQPHARGRIPLFHWRAYQLPAGVAYSLPGGSHFAPRRFIRKMRSGHVGVFGREIAGAVMTTGWTSGRPHTSSPNLPIIELFGPSPRRVFREQLVREQVKAAQAQYEVRLDHEVNYILTRRVPAGDGSAVAA